MGDLINYATKKVIDLPTDFRRTYQLVRSPDFLGVDSFLELCADQLDVPVAELLVQALTPDLKFIRTCYQNQLTYIH